jgi:hypothetical protein
MRVVNSVEREMMQSEWENWLLDESNRCDQVQTVLKAWNGTSTEGGDGAGAEQAAKLSVGGENMQKVLMEKDAKKRDALKGWYEEYCGSCKRDKIALIEERENWSMG